MKTHVQRSLQRAPQINPHLAAGIQREQSEGAHSRATGPLYIKKPAASAVASPVVPRIIPKITDFNRLLGVDALFANKPNDLLNDKRKRAHYVRNTLLKSVGRMNKE